MQLWSKIKDTFYSEYNNLYAFNCVLMMLGILAKLHHLSVYFVVFALAFTPVLFIKKASAFKPIACLCLFFALGYGVMAYRQHTVHTPTISSPLYDTDITGVITRSTDTPNGQTLILSDVSFLNQPTAIIPEKIKLSVKSKEPKLQAGDKITVTAFLRPPAPPVAPGSYNERMVLYFDGIGAVGNMTRLIKQEAGTSTFPLRLEQYRQSIANHIKSVLPDEAAQVAIPLTIGEQSVVSPYIYDIFRKSGITHILSVSGFHLSLLVAFVFFVIRFMLSLIPAVAENYSTKKIAGVFALIAAVAYIAISGMQIPAIRSLIMVSIVLIALLFNRNALSVRSWSIAVIGLMMCRPELIFNISFQLSFMAVLVLVTLYTPLRAYLFPHKSITFVRRFFRGIISFILVDILMMITMTPFIIYHFYQYAPFSLAGNILTGTLLSFWVMPLLFLGLITMPFSRSTVFLKPAGIGIEYIIGVCDKISHIPYALIPMPAFSGASLLCIALGLFCLCLMITKCRYIGLIIVIAGVITAVLSQKPDILIANRGQAVAVWKDDSLFVPNNSSQNYIYDRWLSYYGQDQAKSPELREPLFIKGKRISFHHDTCHQADICFLPESESANARVFPTNRPQTMAVFIQSDGIKITFTNDGTTLWFPDTIGAYR